MKNETTSLNITVTGTEDNEWQGYVQTTDGEKRPFRSVLELLKLISPGTGASGSPRS